MSRQRPDPAEVAQGLPLFEPRLRALVHTADPHTSVRAAATVLREGVTDTDARLLLELVHASPGRTMEAYGLEAAERHGGDPYRWRLKLGRRTGTLKSLGLIHTRGERAGMGLWWLGPLEEEP